MPIDTSMYNQTNGFATGLQNGVALGDMWNKVAKEGKIQRDDDAVREAYKQGVTQNQDGTVSIDKTKTLSGLLKNAPQLALAQQDQWRQQDQAAAKAKMDKQLQVYDTTARYAGAALQNPQMYPQIRADAIKSGLASENDLPETMDEGLMKSYLTRSMSGKEQIAKQQKDQELAQAVRGNDIKQQNADTEKRKAGTMAGQRADASNQKMADSLKKDLDADAGRTGNFGTVSKKVLQAQNLETLANAFPDGNLDSRQIEELSLGLANMLSGSSGAARGQVEALVPHTWTGKMANVQEWLTSDPKGAGQQEFVKRMMHTVQREKETSQQQLNAIREQRLSAHKGYSKADPTGFKSQLQSYGLNPDDYDENLLRKTPAESPGSQSNSNKPAWAK